MKFSIPPGTLGERHRGTAAPLIAAITGLDNISREGPIGSVLDFTRIHIHGIAHIGSLQGHHGDRTLAPSLNILMRIRDYTVPKETTHQ